MSNFSYGEWNLIFFAIVAIFAAIAGFAAGEGLAALIFLPIGGFILYLAFNKSNR
jgi:hypothetical protein